MGNTFHVVLLVAVIGYVKLLRSDYIKQFGVGRRVVVHFIGCGLLGAGSAALGLFPDEYTTWISAGIGLVAGCLAMPWINQPAKEAAEKKAKEKMERFNGVMARTDEPFASKRSAILVRAYTNSYASDEQFERDVKLLGVMLDDQELARAIMNNLLEKSIINQEDEPVEVEPVRKDAICRK